MGKIVVANWKMNPRTSDEARDLAIASDVEDVVLCPPYPFLELVAGVVKKAALGVQDISWGAEGAMTGEVSAKEVEAFGARYAIIGHSERRRYLHETDEMIGKKLRTAAGAGLIPMLCVGETKEEREDHLSMEAITREMSVLKGFTGRWFLVYEPVWAISTEKNAVADTPEDAVRMIRAVKGIVLQSGYAAPERILYGGSVNAGNADAFLKEAEIEGALVGGASLNAEEFLKIIEKAKS